MNFFLICFMVITSAYSQVSGKVEYKFYVPLNIENVPSQDTKNFISRMTEYANKQKFELIFNKIQSKFTYIEKLNDGSDYERKLNNIARTAYTSPDTYTDLNLKRQVALMNDGTILESKIDNKNWEITSESKTIGNYLCYKAIRKTSFIDRNGRTKTNEMVCWFAPSLPYPYGPKNSTGLPGLVLELTEGEKTFIASKIELLSKHVDVNFPKGKTVTKEEYEKRLKENMGAVINRSK